MNKIDEETIFKMNRKQLIDLVNEKGNFKCGSQTEFYPKGDERRKFISANVKDFYFGERILSEIEKFRVEIDFNSKRPKVRIIDNFNRNRTWNR